MQGKFQSTKVFDGFSTVFRQRLAIDTHCRFLHGYGVSFKVWFEGELDHRNWVMDFGRMKRTQTLIDGLNPKEWMDYWLDHTVVISELDPYFDELMNLHRLEIAQVRVMDEVGTEKFAEFLFHKLNAFCLEDTNGRVRVTKVEFREHEKNSAIYTEKQSHFDDL